MEYLFYETPNLRLKPPSADQVLEVLKTMADYATAPPPPSNPSILVQYETVSTTMETWETISCGVCSATAIYLSQGAIWAIIKQCSELGARFSCRLTFEYLRATHVSNLGLIGSIRQAIHQVNTLIYAANTGATIGSVVGYAAVGALFIGGPYLATKYWSMHRQNNLMNRVQQPEFFRFQTRDVPYNRKVNKDQPDWKKESDWVEILDCDSENMA